MGTTQVISSGTIIQFNNNPISFNIDLPDFPLKVIFNFKEDSSSKPTIEAEVPDETTISLSFINYTHSLGVGNTKPLKIADYLGKHIYLNLRVYSLTGSTDKTIHYSYYLSEDII